MKHIKLFLSPILAHQRILVLSLFGFVCCLFWY